MKSRSAKPLIFAIAIAVLIVTSGVRAEPEQQINVSATPASITLPSPLPLTTQEQLSTPTATFTATPAGPVLLEAKTEANVRADADPNAELLGTIRAGDVYPVIGRYYRWYQFQYDKSAGGTGWVFDELVTITGDESKILDMSDNAPPTIDNTAAASTATQESITQTPGGILTATAIAQVIPLPIEGENGAAILTQANPLPGEAAILPTFTYPPDVAPVAPDTALKSDASLLSTLSTSMPAPSGVVFSVSDGLPPIAPILILGGLGLIGLLISSLRR